VRAREGSGAGGKAGEEESVSHAELYTLYCRAYREYDRVHRAGVTPGGRCPPLARAILEFAHLDAQDGTPLRTRAAFDAALACSGALEALGARAA
jgi:hypothetical protein